MTTSPTHVGGVYQQQHDVPMTKSVSGGALSPASSPPLVVPMGCDRARAVDLSDPAYGQSGCMVLSEGGRDARSRAFTRGCWLGLCLDINGFFCVVSECCGLCKGRLDNRYALAGYKYGCGTATIFAGFLMLVVAALSAPFVALEVCPNEINEVHTHWVKQGCKEGGAFSVACPQTEDKCCAAPFLAGHKGSVGDGKGWWDCQQALTAAECQARHNFIRNGTEDVGGAVIGYRRREAEAWSMRCTWRNGECINDCDVWWSPVWYWVTTGVACGVCFLPLCIGGYCMYRAGQQEEQAFDIAHSCAKC